MHLLSRGSHLPPSDVTAARERPTRLFAETHAGQEEKKSGKFNNTAYRTLKKIPTRQPSPNKHLGTDAKAKKKASTKPPASCRSHQEGRRQCGQHPRASQDLLSLFCFIIIIYFSLSPATFFSLSLLMCYVLMSCSILRLVYVKYLSRKRVLFFVDRRSA